MWEDPIVAEVHRVRLEISARFNHDLDAYFRHIRELDDHARANGRTVISIPPPSANSARPMQPDDIPDEDWEDPIVAEIHEVRAQLLAEFDGDVSAYYAYIQQLEAEKRKRGVYYREAPVRDVPKPDAA